MGRTSRVDASVASSSRDRRRDRSARFMRVLSTHPRYRHTRSRSRDHYYRRDDNYCRSRYRSRSRSPSTFSSRSDPYSEFGRYRFRESDRESDQDYPRIDPHLESGQNFQEASDGETGPKDGMADTQRAEGQGKSPDFMGFSPVQNAENGNELDPAFLEALGANPLVPPPLGPALHPSIVERWGHHLTHGLQRDTFKKLGDDYLCPSNLPQLNPPVINPEVDYVLSERHRTIDKGYVNLQRQCATAIAALGVGLSKVIGQGSDAARILGPSYQALLDAARANTALFYNISCIRRRLLFNVCDGSLERLCKDVGPSMLLFGDDLSKRAEHMSGVQVKGQGFFKKDPPAPPRPKTTAKPMKNSSGNGKSQAAHRRGGQAQKLAPSRRSDPKKSNRRNPPTKRQSQSRDPVAAKPTA